MKITEALPVGTVVKLRNAEKRAVIMGIFQQVEENGNKEFFDYMGVPYPEGFIGAENTVLFQQSDVETVFSLGFSDIERQSFVLDAGKHMSNDKNAE